MLELKIQCDCGQKFKFDVEPVNNRMPFTVQCPVCKADGTEKANAKLQQQATAGPMRVTLQTAAAAKSPPPAPAVAVGHATPAPVAVLVDNPTSPAVRYVPPSDSGVAVAAPPGPRVHAAAAAAAAAAIQVKKPSFGMGLLGAAVGTLIGALVYFAVFHFTGYRVKLLAIGVGYLSGLGAELFSRKEGSKELGMLAAVFAIIGLVAAQFVVVRLWWNEANNSEPVAYAAAVADAKAIMAQMPNGSDQEIRTFLAKVIAEEEEEKPDPQAVTADEITEFRETVFPEVRDLASGKTTQADYEKSQAEQAASEKDTDGESFKDAFTLFLLNKFNLLCLVGAAGLAYKACANA